MNPRTFNYLTTRATQEQEAAQAATSATSRLVHFDLAARYRMRARSIELERDR